MPFPIFHRAIIFSLVFPLVTSAASHAGTDGSKSGTTGKVERMERIEELKGQRDRIQQELNLLHRQPEGVGAAAVPQDELLDQLTRTWPESLESVSGTVRQGANGRDLNLSIRGAGR